MSDYEVVKTYYDRARASTLRQLRALSPEMIEWQPKRGSPSIGWFFTNSVVFEDIEITGRFTRNWVLPMEIVAAFKTEKNVLRSRHTLPSKPELEHFLQHLKKQTDRFLKALIDDAMESQFYKRKYGEKLLTDTLRKVVFHEITNFGQIQAFLSLHTSEYKRK